MVLNKEKAELLKNSKKVLLVVSDNEKISHMYNLYIYLKEMGKEVDVYLCSSVFYMCDIININYINYIGCDCILYFPSYGHDRIKSSTARYLHKLIVIQGIHYSLELNDFNLVEDAFQKSISYEHNLREIMEAVFGKFDLEYKHYEFMYIITLYERFISGKELNPKFLFEASYQIQVKGEDTKKVEDKLLNIPNTTVMLYMNFIPFSAKFENGKLVLSIYTARKEVECVITQDHYEVEFDFTASYINVLKAMFQVKDPLLVMLKSKSNKFLIHVDNVEEEINVTARDQ